MRGWDERTKEELISREKIVRFRRNSTTPADPLESETLIDPVIREEWLDLYLKGELVLQTPVLDREIEALIYGFLFGSGRIDRNTSLSIEKSGTSYRVETGDKSSLRETSPHTPFSIPGTAVLRLMEEFSRLPSVYHETGGAHMAAFGLLTAGEVEILLWSDDVSRRNAVDKVIGKVLLGRKDFSRGILLSSGRISSDMIERMTRCGIPMIASLSAPMDKAIRLAEAGDITICGFIREGRMNVYSHPEKISAK